MNTRRLGGSDLQLTPVMFGAWAIGGWMWGGTDENDSIDAIRAALDNGVNAIDTAAIYGFGYSEELVAKALEDRDRSKIIIATKCGLRWDVNEGSEPWETKDNKGKPITVWRNSRPQSIRHECEQSLRRLKVDTIDLYQIHQPDMSTEIEDSIRAIDDLRKQGKIRAIGVSNFKLDLLKRATTVAPIASTQPHYNLLKRDIENDVLPFCLEHNVGVIPYSPMARGLLTGKVGPDRVFPPDDHRNKQKFFTVDNRRRVLDSLAKIKHIADRHRATYAQLAIAWTFQQLGITSAIVGARNAEQSRDNAKAMEIRFEEAELAEIRHAFDETARLANA